MTETTTTGRGGGAGHTVTRLLQRQIMPINRDLDTAALYVDLEAAVLDADKNEIGTNKNAREMNGAMLRQSLSTGASLHPDQMEGRHRLRVRQGGRLSLGTYFNAFPASYWRRWTVVDQVRLTLTLEGLGGTVTVYRSTANGRAQRVDSASTEQAHSTFSFDLPLKPFIDGGWYWYDVVAGDEDLVVASAEWTAEVPADRAEHGTTTVGITTMNRPDFCAELLVQLGEDADLRPYLDEVLVAEQGTDKVVDSPVFAKAEGALGDTLRIIEQANLGGSGGYARGQLETVRRGTATYFMCMDDDVVCEPEGIIRAVTFGDLCKTPTIVGGHMFSLYSKSRLHSFGEVVQPYRFWWESAPGVFVDWEFSGRNLRSSRWLHRRVDVDFNGWFMCLIPRVVLEDVGLSLPLFLKWDDSEFGVRAKKAGYPTVTFPGAAVWHVPWTDKNDALDWQSFFHQRNRFVAALMHSQFPHGGRMVQESFNHQIKHLFSMQYSTLELRHQALEDVLEGPQRLHGDLASRLGEVRALAKQHADGVLAPNQDSFPPPRRAKPKKHEDLAFVAGKRERLVTAAKAGIRQWLPPRALSRTNPETMVPANDAAWYRLAALDSAVVSMPDGTGAALYQRDPALFREQLTRTIAIHQRLLREWPRLAKLYRAQLSEITSPRAWEQTLGLNPDGSPASGSVSSDASAPASGGVR